MLSAITLCLLPSWFDLKGSPSYRRAYWDLLPNLSHFTTDPKNQSWVPQNMSRYFCMLAGGMAALGLFEGFEAKLWRGRGHSVGPAWGLHWCQLGPSWQFPIVGPGPYCKYLGRRDALCAQDQPVIVHIFLEDHVIQDSWKHAQCLAFILPGLAFMYYFICACPQLRTGFVWK